MLFYRYSLSYYEYFSIRKFIIKGCGKMKVMKEKIAKKIVCNAEKIAHWSTGKSCAIGAYEIKPPKELLNKKRDYKE